VAIGEDWPLLTSIPDENEELDHVEFQTLDCFIQDLLIPSSVPTTLTLAAIAQAARVNLRVTFSTPELAFMFSGENGGHATTDNTLIFHVYPSAPTFLINVVDGQFCAMLTPKQNSPTV
jgi:hypothetical protein